MLRGRWCDIIFRTVHAPTEVDVMKNSSFYEETERVFDQFSKYHVNILLHFHANVGTEDIFKSTSGDNSLQKTSNENGVRAANRKTHNQTDHVSIDRRQQSSILDV
jgi:hypothetical protein